MRILIDGYNLIRRVPELAAADRRDTEEGRELLLEQLAPYRAGSRHRVTVVFDGAGSVHLGPGTERIRGVSVMYSARGQSADDVIRKMCAEAGTDVLVTADRQLLDTALRHDITPVDPQEFWEKVVWEQYSSMKGVEEEDEDEAPGARRKGKGGRKLKKKDRLAQRRKDKL